MGVQLQGNFLLREKFAEKFEKLTFSEFSVSVDSSTPSTPSTPCSPSGEPILIEPIRPADKEAILAHLRQFFFRDEPLNCSIDLLGGKGSCPELEDYSTKELGDGLSVKAVLDGRIVGVSLNGVVERGYIDAMGPCDCSDPKFSKIVKLLDHVAVQSDIFAHFPDVEKAMVVKILSVDGTLRGRGIAKDLVNRTRELAKENGCGVMTADCTSHFSARVLKKLNFECIYTLNYEDYKDEQEVVFTPANPHNAITVYSQRV